MKSVTLSLMIILLFGCIQNTQVKTSLSANTTSYISNTTVDNIIALLIKKSSDKNRDIITKGVKQTAVLWQEQDGNEQDFTEFCINNYYASYDEKHRIFVKIENYFESLLGHFTKIGIDLNKNLILDNGHLDNIDKMFGAYNVASHYKDDFFKNKIAFVISLNFPYYSLQEKNTLSKQWNTEQWAWARLGDMFTARIPAELEQKFAKVNSDADVYISQYNIYMGKLRDSENNKLFPDDMILLSHWNLRDEIKSNYADNQNGIKKQQMVYEVMKRIIDQKIPTEVINGGKYEWNPYDNKLFDNGREINFTCENGTRYQQIINSFKVLHEMDKYFSDMDTYIKRNFSGSMEISKDDVLKIFDEYLLSPQTKQVAELIKKRLGRDLQPYDIWYDGFKPRSSISADYLNSITEKKYPNPQAFNDDMANMLMKLGWNKQRVGFIASKISVEPARGSGHALGAEMRDMNSYLRTRIPKTGMNYKGYNIAVHEFGHNVEQTISLHNVPYYSLHGIPNTAFTEALAFIFQSRDLFLLGVNDPNPDKEYLKTLDTFWNLYEIMGVGMVDIKVWEWLYQNPDATANQLQQAVVDIAKDVWNTYYADNFGSRDEPILAIYSHMISYPLYLSAYSFGYLINFQIEQYIAGKNFADEIERIYSLGKLTPEVWMMKATGEKLSNKAILSATSKALEHF
jgi:hypothetical protein